MADERDYHGPNGGMPPPGFREPPYNVEAEQALLGAILVNNEAWHRVRSFLKPDHFYEPVHGRIFAAMERLITAGHVADPITLGRAFRDDEALRELDGAEYLRRMALAAEAILNAEDYGRLIHDLAVRRALIRQAEELVNAAYDAADPREAGELVRQARTAFEAISTESRSSRRPCDLPTIDYVRVAEDQVTEDRWLIQDWLPVGTAGVLAGPGAAGKSFFELMRMICLATGTPFLGYGVTQCPVLGYFAEDDQSRLEARVNKICRGLGIDPRVLPETCEIVSTVGQRRLLATSERFAFTVEVTDWYEGVLARAQARGIRHIAFDHARRLTAVNLNDPGQCFDLFAHLDTLAHGIDGCVSMLAHPSKSDIRAGKGPKVGGSHGMIDAPRWVHVLDWQTPPEEEGGGKYRVLTNEKPNYTRRFAIRLDENDKGLVENQGEVDPDSGRAARRGRPSQAQRTFDGLREMYQTHRRAIALDELVDECVRRGICKEIIKDRDRRDRRARVRSHLDRWRDLLDYRDGDCFAVKPEGLQEGGQA